jgi:hypothetical protein
VETVEMPFVKLDTDALDSSLWSEPSNTIKVFLTMLLMADPEGHVRSTAPGIASRARIALQPVRDALATLEAPDPDDRSGVKEGRRIERCEGGYNIINFLAYRNKDHTAAERKRRQRERSVAPFEVTRDEHGVTRVVTQAEAEAEAEAYSNTRASADADHPPAAGFWRGKEWVEYPDELKGDAFVSCWTEWLKYRRQRRLGYTPIGSRQQLNRIKLLGIAGACEAISYSIAQGYQGIFPPKQASQGVSTYSKNKERVAAVKSAMKGNGAISGGRGGREPVRRALAEPGAERQ